MESVDVSTPGIRYQRILFCTDFSPNADYAFHYALVAAQRSGGAELHILHVLPEPEAQFWKTYLYEVDDVEARASADMNRKISECYLRSIAPPVVAVVTIYQGKAEEEILRFAVRIEADLIVLGRQGSRSPGIHLFGKVTEVIARKAPCPVLIIPHAREGVPPGKKSGR